MRETKFFLHGEINMNVLTNIFLTPIIFIMEIVVFSAKYFFSTPVASVALGVFLGVIGIPFYRYQIHDYKDSKKMYVALICEVLLISAGDIFFNDIQQNDNLSWLFWENILKPDSTISLVSYSFNLLPILLFFLLLVKEVISTKKSPIISILDIGVVLWVYNKSVLINIFLISFVFMMIAYGLFDRFARKKKEIICLAVFITAVLFAIYVVVIGKVHTMLTNDEYKDVPGVVLYCLILVFSLLGSYYVGVKGINICLKADWKNYAIFSSILCLLLAVVIPSFLISAAPLDFTNSVQHTNPLHFLTTALEVAIGTCLIWGFIYYYILNECWRGVLIYSQISIVVISYVNFTFWGHDLGTITANLSFAKLKKYNDISSILNLILCLLILGLIYLLCTKKYNYIRNIGYIVLAYSILMSVINITNITIQVRNMETEVGNVDTKMKLSTDGKNVIVLVLDRCISSFLPLIMEEKPELKDKFEGFTYYPNCISYANYTATAAVPIWGGYEYQPLVLNDRENETWQDKTDEALMVMPTIFSRAGYNVFVNDSPNISSMSIYEQENGIIPLSILGKYTEDYCVDEINEMIRRNMFFYSIFKIAPACLQREIYSDGAYMSLSGSAKYANELVEGYAMLEHMKDFIEVEMNSDNNYLQVYNFLPHMPTYLQTPDYTLEGMDPDNEGYDYNGIFEREDLSKINHEDEMVLQSYHVNMASMILVGNFLDYLREQGAYDNTRIIIVADHGYGLGNKVIDIDGKSIDVTAYNPILLVKDFDSKSSYNNSDELMTNADVPILATDNLVDQTNPFTGNNLRDMCKKDTEGIIITTSSMFDMPIYKGLSTVNKINTQFPWYCITDYIFDGNNWKEYRAIK